VLGLVDHHPLPNDASRVAAVYFLGNTILATFSSYDVNERKQTLFTKMVLGLDCISTQISQISTGDRHLLTVEECEGLRIINSDNFMEILARKKP
jgi:hypothetical protein